jgi:biotin carboxyl carrier protein
MKLRLHSGSETFSHTVELEAAQDKEAGDGRFKLLFDGAAERHADCIAIAPDVYSIILDGRSYEARVSAAEPGAGASAGSYSVVVGGEEYRVEIQDPRARRRGGMAGEGTGPQEILAPMPGKIVKVLVEENQEVKAGQGLIVIEAMKMQNELRAPRPGRVEKVHVSEGLGVEAGFKLLRLI